MMSGVPLADCILTVERPVLRKVRFVVYDKTSHLRAAATQYENVTKGRTKKRRCDYKNTVGICHPFELWKPEGKGKNKIMVQDPLCAIVRLARPNIGMGVLSHEMAHAAVHIHEMNTGGPVVQGEDEDFAWVLGDLVRQAVIKMNELKIYDE